MLHDGLSSRSTTLLEEVSHDAQDNNDVTTTSDRLWLSRFGSRGGVDDGNALR
jgi:hypothetical protein